LTICTSVAALADPAAAAESLSSAAEVTGTIFARRFHNVEAASIEAGLGRSIR